MSPTKSETLKEKYPSAWIPTDEGDELVGKVIDLARAWSDARALGNNGNGWYPLLKIEKDDGIVVDFHAFQTVAMNQVNDKRPIQGDRVKITYRGEGKAKDNKNAPKLFYIMVEGRDPTEQASRIYAQIFGADDTPPVAQTAEPSQDTSLDDVPFD